MKKLKTVLAIVRVVIRILLICIIIIGVYSETGIWTALSIVLIGIILEVDSWLLSKVTKRVNIILEYILKE